MKIASDANDTSLSLWSSATESAKPNVAQDKVEQLRAALLCPDADIAPALRALRLSKVSEPLASLKSAQDTSPINELLADGLKIQSTDLRKLANAAGIDLAPYQLLTDDQGELVTVLPKCSGEDPDELVMCWVAKIRYCHRARSSPAALARLIDYYKIELNELLSKGFADADLEDSLPFLRYCNFRDIDSEKQAAWLLKTNPSKLRYLSIQSDRIEELPRELPQLKELYCRHCPALRALPERLPLLELLNCQGCSILQSLPEDLPLLTDLSCIDCTALQTLPENLPMLGKLICLGCTTLQKLPSQLSLLQQLDCSGCSVLHSLPTKLPLLLELNCSCCPLLPSLPAELPLLQKLCCGSCPQLQALPAELPLLQTLYCTECPQLQSLPVALPSCRELNYSYCPHFANSMLPELPANATVYSEQVGSGFSNMNIPLHTLKETPLHFLLELGTTYLLRGRPFP
ncbi:MAG: hypothetical protein KDK78_05705, partial [Chlamydiia bacterium]|nr:hypothetical protein [Chlamydiia bacterium]